MARLEQLQHLERVKATILDRYGCAGLHTMEFVVPFVPTDSSLVVWFFYKTDEQVNRGVLSAKLVSVFKQELKKTEYNKKWIPAITFHFDSHERVEREYEGNYFYF